MYMNVLSACMSAPNACLVPWGGQKSQFDPLELELQMVVGHHVGAGTWTRVLLTTEPTPVHFCLFILGREPVYVLYILIDVLG